MQERNRIQYLFDKYLNNNISEEGYEEFFSYLSRAEEDDILKEEIMEVYGQALGGQEQNGVAWERILAEIAGKLEKERTVTERGKIRKIKRWRKVAAAALICILAGAATYGYLQRNHVPKTMAADAPAKIDILPGSNRAILTLSNGVTIVLDSSKNGNVAKQGNVNVLKIKGGGLAYQVINNHQTPLQKNQAITYNTLTTPRGGEYRLTLSDGTKVWLNAASSIRYPAVFTGKERTVAVVGEAYFEVKHDSKMPFKVQVGTETIEDLGTRFDVNAYPDETSIKMTLLEGSIKVGKMVLTPGQQAIVGENGDLTVIVKKNPEDAISWTKGFFSFNNATLREVMQKLSRWYDIEVFYQEGADNMQRFSGKIDRSLTLTELLNGLRQTRAHFKIEPDRKVWILR